VRLSRIGRTYCLRRSASDRTGRPLISHGTRSGGAGPHGHSCERREAAEGKCGRLRPGSDLKRHPAGSCTRRSSTREPRSVDDRTRVSDPAERRTRSRAPAQEMVSISYRPTRRVHEGPPSQTLHRLSFVYNSLDCIALTRRSSGPLIRLSRFNRSTARFQAGSPLKGNHPALAHGQILEAWAAGRDRFDRCADRVAATAAAVQRHAKRILHVVPLPRQYQDYWTPQRRGRILGGEQEPI